MKKIIVVEDDTDTLDILEYILRDAGYVVIKAKRPISIDEFCSIKPDLAILDVMLTFGLGSDLCLGLKSDPKTKHIPVILYSASSNLKKIAEKCLADAYIEKPFDLNKLVEKVNEMAL